MSNSYFDSKKVEAEIKQARQEAKQKRLRQSITFNKIRGIAALLGMPLDEVLNTVFDSEYRR